MDLVLHQCVEASTHQEWGQRRVGGEGGREGEGATGCPRTHYRLFGRHTRVSVLTLSVREYGSCATPVCGSFYTPG
eukprot:797047-Rhodomonas_salina.1